MRSWLSYAADLASPCEREAGCTPRTTRSCVAVAEPDGAPWLVRAPVLVTEPVDAADHERVRDRDRACRATRGCERVWVRERACVSARVRAVVVAVAAAAVVPSRAPPLPLRAPSRCRRAAVVVDERRRRRCRRRWRAAALSALAQRLHTFFTETPYPSERNHHTLYTHKGTKWSPPSQTTRRASRRWWPCFQPPRGGRWAARPKATPDGPVEWSVELANRKQKQEMR